MNRILFFALVIGFAFMFFGCKRKENNAAPSPPASVSVEMVKVIEGLDLPECLVIDPGSGDIFVSNVVTDKEGYWDNDGNGFISRLSADGEIKELRWLDSTEAMSINGPKGMCILNEVLYFNDNNTLKFCPFNEPGKVGVIVVPGAVKLNDLATDGENIWVTDTKTGNIFRIDSSENVSKVCNLEGVNGVTCAGNKVYAVSWDLHEIYEIDPEGKIEPKPFGLADKFLSLDCIEVLDDGSFIVSDWKGNMLYSISADRKTVTELKKIESAADFALDRKKGLLYVPEMLKNRALILKLKQ